MEFTFSDLHFTVNEDGKLLLDRCFGYDNRKKAAINKLTFPNLTCPAALPPAE